jgi:hypothetical protein
MQRGTDSKALREENKHDSYDFPPPSLHCHAGYVESYCSHASVSFSQRPVTFAGDLLQGRLREYAKICPNPVFFTKIDHTCHSIVLRDNYSEVFDAYSRLLSRCLSSA